MKQRQECFNVNREISTPRSTVPVLWDLKPIGCRLEQSRFTERWFYVALKLTQGSDIQFRYDEVIVYHPGNYDRHIVPAAY